MGDLLEAIEDSLKDMNHSEIKVLKSFCAKQRLNEKDRPGLLKFYSAVYCLLEAEQYRRKVILKEHERDLSGIGEIQTEWGQTDV